MKNFVVVIDGFGTEDTVNTLMDAIKGTVPVDENDVVIARMTAVVGTKHVDYHTDKEVCDNLEKEIPLLTYVFLSDDGHFLYIDAYTEEEAYELLDDTVKHTDEFELSDVINMGD